MSTEPLPPVTDRYLGGDYLNANPEWHVADSPWKAQQVLAALDGWTPATVCEVGCGAGAILEELQNRLPAAAFVGYDIAPEAIAMAQRRARPGLEFRLRDIADDTDCYDLMLLMDVIEHVSDPIGFMASLHGRARRVILHIPLDLSAQSVLRPTKLLERRRQVGHIHYFTPETAIATVSDAGYQVLGHTYTRSFDLVQKTVKAKLALLPRRVLPSQVTVRLLGGYSLLVVAEPV